MSDIQPKRSRRPRKPWQIGTTSAPEHPLALAPLTAPEQTVDGFVTDFLRELNTGQGVLLSHSTVNDQYLALARTVLHHLMARWLETQAKVREQKAKTVAYLSAEYLLGRQLGNALLATDLNQVATEALTACGLDIEILKAQELEPGLGNGGLGRLAACFLDSLATMSVPCIGYGIRYEYGIFRQTFIDGRQVEQADTWLALGSPWEFPHPEAAVTVGFGGNTIKCLDDDGVERLRWYPSWQVLGVPYNYMVPGYLNGCVNTLRLWSARATKAFDLEIFNAGDYAEAVRAQTTAENITKVLYPEDSTPQGKELRLQQQYFFVACSLQDFINRTLAEGFDLHDLPDRVIFQLNDTHPVIAIPELMRILVDEHPLAWEEAWAVTSRCFAYTCHTLLPEALEIWSADLLASLLPRHLEIICRINDDFCSLVRATDSQAKVFEMSIITDQSPPKVRMAHLATVAATKVNGVAELHSQLLCDQVLTDFAQLWPSKFTNVTNGVTPRRFIRLANPPLAELITETIGDTWLTNLDQLKRLEPYADNQAFRARFVDIKAANKCQLSDWLKLTHDIDLPTDHLLDVMIKRMHEYKRQPLKLLHVISLYQQVLDGQIKAEEILPRTVLFGAKAAPGYQLAKETIYLINSVAKVVNADRRLDGRLKIIFVPDYNVSTAQRVITAADLSEQISLAGKEASGTGNMKLALNGALTIGTDDGANIEIRQLVGDDNFFLFGMTEAEAVALATAGYDPRHYYQSDARLKAAIDLISQGAFSDGDATVFAPFIDQLLNQDRFMNLADFAAYMDAQGLVETAYRNQDSWTRSSILNIARCGYFSSDRSVADYLDRIWQAVPLT